MEEAETAVQYVYRRGNKTRNNFTPRPDKDTVSQRPGQAPGLSTEEMQNPIAKSQCIDVRLLSPPLRAVPDDVDQQGTPGHVSIVPVKDDGEVDIALLQQWAASRDKEEAHPFTQMILDAIVEIDSITSATEDTHQEKNL